MCVNRGWQDLNIKIELEDTKSNLIFIRAKRNDGFYKVVMISINNFQSSLETCIMIENGIKKLESYRNCECPKNPDCHKEINGKLNIIIAKE